MYTFSCNNPSALIAKKHANLKKSDMARIHVGTFNGEIAWSNGFFMEVAPAPVKYQKTVEIVQAAKDFNTFSGMTVAKDATLGEPLAYWHDDETNPHVIVGNESAWNAFNPAFVGYFLKRYPGCTFMLPSNVHFATSVMHNGKQVGAIMPYHIDEKVSMNSDYASILADYGIATSLRPNLKPVVAVVAPAPAHVIVCTYDVDAPVSKPRYRVPLAIMQAACGVTPAPVVAVEYDEIIDFTGAEYSSFTYEVNCGPYCRMDVHYGDSYYVWPQAGDANPIAVEVQAATVAQLEDAIDDDVDAEIDEIMNRYAGYDVAAG